MLSADALLANLRATTSEKREERKNAEDFLLRARSVPRFLVYLLQLIKEAQIEEQVRLAASICFKNLIKNSWKICEGEESVISVDDRNEIKKEIVDLMLSSPVLLQNQLSEAITIIGREDFPDNWPDLLAQMVAKMATGDFHIINGVLKTAESLFTRYRYDCRSDKLWKEINHVLKEFAEPLTQLFSHTLQLLEQHESNENAVKVLLDSIFRICELFYLLNCQDLPAFFEDNMERWMSHFEGLLKLNGQKLNSLVGSDGETRLLARVKAQICENIGLYAEKYDEEFTSYLARFIQSVWRMLVEDYVGEILKQHYDELVGCAIEFLALVSSKVANAEYFNQPTVLNGLCEKIILPNMEIRNCDLELFKDSPEDYIQNDFGGSHGHSRRKAACDLVKSLCILFEGPVISTFTAYVEKLLAAYDADRSNFRGKDAAIFLVASMTVKGHTDKKGATATANFVNISVFFQKQILPELLDTSGATSPLIKADCLKFLILFRSLLSADVVLASFNQLHVFLLHPSAVVHSYAAMALDKILLMQASSNAAEMSEEFSGSWEPCFEKRHYKTFVAADRIEHSQELLHALCSTLSSISLEENRFLMKGLMRLLAALGTKALPSFEFVVPYLCQVLSTVLKNPSNPHFNHYLFECLALCIKTACSTNPEFVRQFETSLQSVCHQILTDDISEFVPYAFQLYSLMLSQYEVSQLNNSVPDYYVKLFRLLLNATLWEKDGNVASLVRLFSSYMFTLPSVVASSVPALIKIFGKLNSRAAHDHEGFMLIADIFEHLPASTVDSCTKEVLLYIFQRLTRNKTEKYCKGALRFFCKFCLLRQPNDLVSLVDACQPNLFGMVLEKIFLPYLRTMHADKQTVLLGSSRLLVEAKELCPLPPSGKYAKYVPEILLAVLEINEKRTVTNSRIAFFEELEEINANSILVFGSLKDRKMHSGVKANDKTILSSYLSQAKMSLPSLFEMWLTCLPENAKEALRLCAA